MNMTTKPRMHGLLLCPPDHYGIEYEINPWMDRTRKPDQALASTQWQCLRDRLRLLGCALELIESRPGLPDMVFTANAGLVVGTRFIRSNFRYNERRGEEAFFEQWFTEYGYEVVRLPEKLIFEGEGDALFSGEVLFCGYRFRSDIKSHQWLGDLLNCLVISVELVDARFYHLDTCFCPVSDSSAIWYPAAFDDYGQRAIREHVADLIEVSPDEALRFACNAVVLDRDIVLSDGCAELCAALSRRGYRSHEASMSELIKAGGACKCLTLFLPQRQSLT
jgi:N-dimethylarginine dimethylaminohydrolase